MVLSHWAQNATQKRTLVEQTNGTFRAGMPERRAVRHFRRAVPTIDRSSIILAQISLYKRNETQRFSLRLIAPTAGCLTRALCLVGLAEGLATTIPHG